MSPGVKSIQTDSCPSSEKDYPPRADAGSDQVIFLPQNSLNLYGNKSSDDKGDIEYEWIADGKLTAGMTVGWSL